MFRKPLYNSIKPLPLYRPAVKISDLKRMPADLIYRKARLDDRESVIDIDDNVYDGRDFLPHVINDLINNHQAFVCQQHDGLVVAFLFVVVLDGGETVVFRGGRVRSSHTGKQILDILVQTVLRDVHVYLPKMKRSAFCMNADGEVYVKRIKKYEKMGIKPGFSTVNSSYKGTLSRCVKIQNSELKSKRLRHVDKEMLMSIFQFKSMHDILFPDHMMHVYTHGAL